MLKILFTTGSKSTVTYRTEIFNITVTLGDKILFSYNNPVHLSYSYKYVGRLLDSFLSKNLINSKLLHPHPHPHPLWGEDRGWEGVKLEKIECLSIILLFSSVCLYLIS